MRTFTVEPSRETENYMEMCLGLFYAPSRSIPDDVSIENVMFNIINTKSQWPYRFVNLSNKIKTFNILGNR